MATTPNWKLLEVEALHTTNPGFFARPLLDLKVRRTAQVGETVKVAASIEIRGEWKTRAIWLVVDDNSSDPGRYVGRPHPSYLLKFGPRRDCQIQFGPEHIYRMEPREYTIWGRDGYPLIAWGNTARPESSDGTPVMNVEPICTLQSVNGFQQLQKNYEQLASQNEWPPYEELKRLD